MTFVSPHNINQLVFVVALILVGAFVIAAKFYPRRAPTIYQYKLKDSIMTRSEVNFLC